MQRNTPAARVARTEPGENVKTKKTTRKRRQLKPEIVGDRMSREEAAAALGVHVSTIWRFARLGRVCRDGSRVFLNALDLGGALYFDRDDLLSFARECARANRRP
jgi:hypothetical protein